MVITIKLLKKKCKKRKKICGEGKKLGITVEVELKSDKGEQVATQIQASSLHYPMPFLVSSINQSRQNLFCSVILLGKEHSLSCKIPLTSIPPMIHSVVLSAFPDTGYVH